MRARRFMVVVAVSAAVGGLLSSGGAVASPRSALSHFARGWSAVPAAARGPVANAIARHDVSRAPAALHLHELMAPTGQAGEEFGTSAAVSADTLVIGAPAVVDSNAGAAYVFHRPASGWAHARLVATLTATDIVSGDQFGGGVAVNGRTILVSASHHEVGTNPWQGAVYVFVEPASGWSGTLEPAAELTASDGGVNDYFGWYSVAVSGNTVAVGGVDHSPGAVYLFVKPPTGWSGVLTQTAELVASAGGDRLGAGQAGISSDGTTVVAGAGYQTVGSNVEQGAVYVFVEPKLGWSGTMTESAELTASGGGSGDQLGIEGVGISGDAVVAGAAYQDVGANADQGAVYVFVKPKSGWLGPMTESAELLASNGTAGADLGYSAVISGTTVVSAASYQKVGMNSDQGAMYVFTEPAHGWSGTVHQTAEKTAPDGEVDDVLGYPATAAFGTTAVVGSFSHKVAMNSEQGAAYIFAPLRPSLSKLKQSATSWRAGSRRAVLNPAHKPKKGGTRFSFSLSQAGTLTLTFVRHIHGHSKPAGTLTFTAPPGHNALYFFGRLKPHKPLSSGKYSASFSTANTAGISTHHTLHFKLTKH